MTNEEAIKILKEEILGLSEDNPFYEAVDLAIKALEPVKRCKFCKHYLDTYYCLDCHSDHSLFEE